MANTTEYQTLYPISSLEQRKGDITYQYPFLVYPQYVDISGVSSDKETDKFNTLKDFIEDYFDMKLNSKYIQYTNTRPNSNSVVLWLDTSD